MSSKGVGHRKTKKHARLNYQHYREHSGDKPITLESLHTVVEPKVRKEKASAYYCEKCGYSHLLKSRIGIEHIKVGE